MVTLLYELEMVQSMVQALFTFCCFTSVFSFSVSRVCCVTVKNASMHGFILRDGKSKFTVFHRRYSNERNFISMLTLNWNNDKQCQKVTETYLCIDWLTMSTVTYDKLSEKCSKIRSIFLPQLATLFWERCSFFRFPSQI